MFCVVSQRARILALPLCCNFFYNSQLFSYCNKDSSKMTFAFIKKIFVFAKFSLIFENFHPKWHKKIEKSEV